MIQYFVAERAARKMFRFWFSFFFHRFLFFSSFSPIWPYVETSWMHASVIWNRKRQFFFANEMQKQYENFAENNSFMQYSRRAMPVFLFLSPFFFFTCAHSDYVLLSCRTHCSLLVQFSLWDIHLCRWFLC